MSYYIDIIDTTSPLVQIAVKDASSSGIVLEWNGGDSKDGISIVGSNLKFDMLTDDDTDMYFAEFFTGDEHRFKTQIKNSTDDTIHWQGYILPDLYSEPYKNVRFFVSFTATDGLGRLKGKYLPADYYVVEKSLIAIYSQILKLTGLELELYFSPAIENYSNKNWDTIYIDTESFIESNKNQDAYSIFETLLQDTLCICYQCDNRWYIEGMNIRNNKQVTYKNYDANGSFIGTVVFDRLQKKITALDVPQITIIPPYNEINVTHKKTEPTLIDAVSKEKNKGWAVVTGVNGVIDASQWMANGNYYAKCPVPDYAVTVYNQFYFDSNPTTIWIHDATKYVSLRNKIYVAPGTKIKFELEFDIVHPVTGTAGTPGDWNDSFRYEILSDYDILFSNSGGVVEDREKIIFSDSGKCKIEIETVCVNEGMIDIKLYRPIGRVSDNGVLGVKLNAAKINILGFEEVISETDLINGDYTIDKYIELTYAEDKTGFSNGFRLSKLKELTAAYNEIEVPISYAFTLDSKFYAVLQLEGADLIDKNKYQVYYSGAKVLVIAVVYNLNGGEQMVVETDVPYTSGSFFVKKYAIESVISNRNHWEQWADAFYKIEKTSYVKTISNIYRRMFDVANEKIDLTALNAVKFNDIVQFNYVFLKNFVVLNCTWNLDKNKTDLVLGRANYADSSSLNTDGTNIPPIVVAGDDIFITALQTTASLTATAYDPDGVIVSQVWTKTVGGSGDVIATPTLLATDLSNLTEDYYTYQIEVTDNSGISATDTVNVIRIKDYTVTLDLTETITNANKPKLLRKKFRLNVSPALPAGYSLTFNGEFLLDCLGDSTKYRSFIHSTAWFNLYKNTVLLEGKTITSTSDSIPDEIIETTPVVFNYITGDAIDIVLCSIKNNDLKGIWNFKSLSQFKLLTVNLVSGFGNIIGVPSTVQTLISK